jgi:hypothetical protein
MGVGEDFQKFKDNYQITTELISSISYRYKRITKQLNTDFWNTELRQRRDDLQMQLHKIYRIAPHTNIKAYGKAQDALKNKEDLTFTDSEIDAFLPAPLKRTVKAGSEPVG